MRNKDEVSDRFTDTTGQVENGGIKSRSLPADGSMRHCLCMCGFSFCCCFGRAVYVHVKYEERIRGSTITSARKHPLVDHDKLITTVIFLVGNAPSCFR